MYKWFIYCVFLVFASCKFDNKDSGRELIEVNSDTLQEESLPLTTSDEILDVAPEHMGGLTKRDGEYVIVASDFVEATITEDYNSIKNVLENYSSTFNISARKTADTPSKDRDSIVSMKFKASLIEFRKRDGKEDQLVLANFKNELFLLQNGLRTGLDRQEMLAKFGIKEQVMQDTIEVVSEKNENKIVLFMKKDMLIKIEILPEQKK
ncbi:MAG: hypothetical protein KA987_07940 [Saprospiraceae bacterium]|nr:hypothetical protein [Saprospiraceae bacterium]